MSLFAVVTHPRIYKPPTTMDDAVLQVDYWMESPTLRLIGEGPGYWEHLKTVLAAGRVVGPLAHDARTAAICRAHAVTELWSADRDYSRFSGLRIGIRWWGIPESPRHPAASNKQERGSAKSGSFGNLVFWVAGPLLG